VLSFVSGLSILLPLLLLGETIFGIFSSLFSTLATRIACSSQDRHGAGDFEEAERYLTCSLPVPFLALGVSAAVAFSPLGRIPTQLSVGPMRSGAKFPLLGEGVLLAQGSIMDSKGATYETPTEW
jgi:hypothetical protein